MTQKGLRKQEEFVELSAHGADPVLVGLSLPTLEKKQVFSSGSRVRILPQSIGLVFTHSLAHAFQSEEQTRRVAVPDHRCLEAALECWIFDQQRRCRGRTHCPCRSVNSRGAARCQSRRDADAHREAEQVFQGMLAIHRLRPRYNGAGFR